jgi:sensor histidine kinase YesM
VATNQGLSIITKLNSKSSGVCLLNHPIVKVENKVVLTNAIALNPGEDIQFEYDGISFKSEGDISYQYRLLGIDSIWKITKQRLINFSFLPYGNYNFELFAINKFGVKSKLINVPFRVNKRLYEETYFRIIICLIIISMVFLLFQKRNQVNKEKYLQKLQNAQKIMELEQEALKAQMNPHFIFNCLNAIQHYIIEKDVMSANKFISSFAGLIRQALDNSGRKSISINEEITFLKSYIEIEQNRFEDRFLYQLNVGNEIETDLLQIPPMLIQPFVENAINHGLLHKRNEIGKLDVDFSLSEQMLKIIISDNGIGRIASNSFSHHKEISHLSKGIELTKMRISRLNYYETSKIKLEIVDKYDTGGNSTGTQVEILIPLIFNN